MPLTARYGLCNISDAVPPSKEDGRQGLAPEVSDLKDERPWESVNQPSRDKGVLQHMLRIQILGLALVSALMLSALAAGSASAAELHQWLLVHDLSGGGQVHLLLAAPIRVHTEGLLLLEDSTPGTKVHCHGFGAGTVGPHGLDLTESITLELLGTKKTISCTFDKVGLCKSGTEPVAEAVHLPWHTQLLLRGTQVRDLILAHGGGTPGYAVTCTNILGGKTTDECLEAPSKPASTLMKNEIGSGVLGTFNTESPAANCSQAGGAEGTGKVAGTVLTKNPSSTLLLETSFGP